VSEVAATTGQVDVVIVGGGVSGLYTAWRVLSAAKEAGGPMPKVVVYEMSERVGGRLLTWLPTGPTGGLRAELGGMRFFENQQLLWSLLAKLGFGTADIVPFYVGGENLLLRLRGENMPLDNPPHPTARYLVEPAVAGLSPQKAMEGVIEEVLGTNENKAALQKFTGTTKPPTSREKWDAVKPHLSWQGEPLGNVGFWNLISEIRDSETYDYLGDGFGYYSLASNWNAAEAFQFIWDDFSGEPDYHTLAAGYSALPERLEARVRELGGQIVLGTRLASFETLADSTTRAKLVGPSGPIEVVAGKLVLAMPRRSLDLLGSSPGFDLRGDPRLNALVDSLISVPAFKLFLFFEQRWWEKQGITKGRSVCDLPIRQTYYMAPDSLYSGGKTPPWGLLMASYDDERAVDYWQGMVPAADQVEEGRTELRRAVADLVERAGPEEATAADVGELPPHLHLAPQPMVDRAMEQIRLLHAPFTIPEPSVGAFADWGLDPFGGGWNFWKPGVDVKTTMEKIRMPLGTDHSVFVVGEAYSGVQGWVEGALTTTELTLQRHFALKPPPWLPGDYYLGW
jgi:monoamine oxidase